MEILAIKFSGVLHPTPLRTVSSSKLHTYLIKETGVGTFPHFLLWLPRCL